MRLQTGGNANMGIKAPTTYVPSSPIARPGAPSYNFLSGRGSAAPISRPAPAPRPASKPKSTVAPAAARRISRPAPAPAPVPAPPSHAVNPTGQVVKTAPTPPVAPVVKPTPPPAPTAPETPTPVQDYGVQAPAMPQQVPIPLDQWLGTDTVYQGQLADLQKQFADYQANQQLQRNQYDQQYAQELNQLDTQKGTDLKALADDYASRGLLQSGLYADALGKYNTQYDTQKSAYDTGHQSFLDNLVAALNEFQTQQGMSKTNAQAEAAARRAAQYNLSLASMQQ